MQETPKPTRAERRSARREEIVAKYVELARKSPGKDITMGDIARELGAAVGTAYTYFAGKDHLVHAAREHVLENMGTTYIDIEEVWALFVTPIGDPVSRAELGAAQAEQLLRLVGAYEMTDEELRLWIYTGPELPKAEA